MQEDFIDQIYFSCFLIKTKCRKILAASKCNRGAGAFSLEVLTAFYRLAVLEDFS